MFPMHSPESFNLMREGGSNDLLAPNQQEHISA